VIVLVDDVVRTGSTLRACAEAIRTAGDEGPVVAIVLAAAVDLAGSGDSGRWRLPDEPRPPDRLQADR
jgi:adenine/guanine phosphoribosyltransferase-like PRPP-binding protein